VTAPHGESAFRALIVGLGSIGQRHARNLRALLGGSVELSAYRARGLSHVIAEGGVASDQEAVSDRLAIREFTNLDDALAQRPDIAFVCNPTRLHLPVAQRLAEAGCHLFIEKPIADTLEGVEELERTVRAKNLVAVVGCQLRFHPLLQRVHALLRERALGQVVAARIAVGEYLPGWHPYEDYRTSYAARRDLGGGVILTLIHELDYAFWLFGAPRKLFAVGGHLSDLEIDVEDTASILMDCGSDGRALPVHVQMDFVQRPPTRSCEITGSDGRIALDLTAATLRRYDSDGDLVEERSGTGFVRNQLFLDELTHFLACVRGIERPLVPLADGIATLRIALAARDAIDTGRLATPA
jgi:predicted dehydrogenase